MYYETPTNDKSAREQIDKVIQVSDRRYRMRLRYKMPCGLIKLRQY